MTTVEMMKTMTITIVDNNTELSREQDDEDDDCNDDGDDVADEDGEHDAHICLMANSTRA